MVSLLDRLHSEIMRIASGGNTMNLGIRRAVAMMGAVAIAGLSACTVGGSGTPVSTTGSIVVTTQTSGVSTVDAERSSAAASQSQASAAAAQSAAESSAAEQAAVASQQAAAAAAQAAAEEAAAQAAAEQAAAEQAAADQAAAEQAAAAEQQAAEQAAAEAAAAAQAEAESEAESGLQGWYTPNGNWISPETAARAMAAGIAPGETVPNYLRCGTICGEGPTSGEVQMAHLCLDGAVPPADCEGIDPQAIIDAASGYAG